MNFRATSANGRGGDGYPSSSHDPFTPLSARVVLCRRAARQGRKYVWEYMVASVTASNHRKTKTATNQPRRLHLRGGRKGGKKKAVEQSKTRKKGKAVGRLAVGVTELAPWPARSEKTVVLHGRLVKSFHPVPLLIERPMSGQNFFLLCRVQSTGCGSHNVYPATRA